MSDNTFLLSIAIPTYNGSSTIGILLDSILNQYDKRVEIIILNNCSTDNTREILESYKCKYPFIRIKDQECNIGPDANFLDCFREATGKFVHLISDDDVLFEGALKIILDFLENNADTALIYLNTVGFYGNYVDKSSCDQSELNREVETFKTLDRRKFMSEASHYWGFVSSFICSKNKFSTIQNPEKYFKTYWLQSYIHILCARDRNSTLGVIGYPCVGAGRYINVNNFDSVLVDGIYYKRMLDFAVDNAYFDKKQVKKWHKKRFYMLARHNIIKEKAIGIKKMDSKRLFSLTYKSPEAWLTLYPLYLIPAFVCRTYNNFYRKKKGIFKKGEINRFE